MEFGDAALKDTSERWVLSVFVRLVLSYSGRSEALIIKFFINFYCRNCPRSFGLKKNQRSLKSAVYFELNVRARWWVWSRPLYIQGDAHFRLGCLSILRLKSQLRLLSEFERWVLNYLYSGRSEALIIQFFLFFFYFRKCPISLEPGEKSMKFEVCCWYWKHKCEGQMLGWELAPVFTGGCTY